MRDINSKCRRKTFAQLGLLNKKQNIKEYIGRDKEWMKEREIKLYRVSVMGYFFDFPTSLIVAVTVAVSVEINKQCHKQNNTIKTDRQTGI